MTIVNKNTKVYTRRDPLYELGEEDTCCPKQLDTSDYDVGKAHPPLTGTNRLALLSKALSSAELAIRSRADLLRLAPVIIPLKQIAALPLALARVDNRAGVAVVGVNTAQHTTVDGDGALDVDVARAAVAVAVAATADELAVVLGVEVGDDDVAAAVELEDLVRGREGAAAVDVGGAGLLLEGRGVLADILPPDVVEGAGEGLVRVLGDFKVEGWGGRTKCLGSEHPRPGRGR